MEMDAFSKRHPAVNFLFFLGAIGCAVVIQHPAYVLAGLVCAALCAWAATGLDTGLLRKLFGGFLVLIGLRELLGRGKGKQEGEPGA